jgi:hypothetical protein
MIHRSSNGPLFVTSLDLVRSDCDKFLLLASKLVEKEDGRNLEATLQTIYVASAHGMKICASGQELPRPI